MVFAGTPRKKQLLDFCHLNTAKEEELLLQDPEEELLLKAVGLLKTPHTPRTLPYNLF